MGAQRSGQGFGLAYFFNIGFSIFPILSRFSIDLFEPVLGGKWQITISPLLFSLCWTCCLCHSLIPPKWKDSWLLQIGRVTEAEPGFLGKRMNSVRAKNSWRDTNWDLKLWLTFWQHASLCQITSFLLECDCWSPSQSSLLLLLFSTQLRSRSWQSSGWPTVSWGICPGLE